MKPRFVVTELEGFLIDGYSRQRGISVQVLDRALNHRVVASWRSEDYRPAASKSGREQVRERAARLCAELNGEPMRTRPEPKHSTVCPSCYGPKSHVSLRCARCAVRFRGPRGRYARRRREE